MTPLLVLRPEPGNTRTLAAARALGLRAIAAPLFTVAPVAWALPAGPFDALMLTSANAVRHAAGLEAVRHLPAYAVGAATAQAARQAGIAVAHVGDGDAADLVAAMATAGVTHALHLAGAIHRDVADPALSITRVVVYRAVPAAHLPESARMAWDERPVVLVHSPAAGALLARLVDAGGLPRTAAIAAISHAAADATGAGWAGVAIAAQPSDAALLAIAARLCEEAPGRADGRA